MSDGVTLNRTAAAIRTALVGKPMHAFSAPAVSGMLPEPGRVIERVSCHGKSMEVLWDNGVTLRTKMRLHGSWHLYRAGERWRKPTRHVRVSIEVAQWVAVCFSSPSVEVFRQFDRNRHPGHGGVGPNMCDSRPDVRRAVERLLSYADPSAALADVLLDERVLSGLGNVFRSELLWGTEFDPWVEVGSLAPADAEQLVNAAHRILADRIGDAGYGIALKPSDAANLAVYGRNGQRCQRCGDTIQAGHTGDDHRLLYWCGGCQLFPSELSADCTPLPSQRPFGPHPAEELFLSDLPWRRTDTHSSDRRR